MNILRESAMERLFNEIGLEKELEARVCELLKNEKSNIEKLVVQCKNNGFSCLKNKNDLLKLAVCLEYSKFTKEEYERLGIDEEIYYDTMRDIKIWCENNSNKGLKNSNWIQNHLKFELFKIGRLQYQFYTYSIPKYRKAPFKKGEKLIYIHIPQGEKLIYSDCVESLKRAIEFFNKYFPDYEYSFFFCESWLLYQENYAFMDISSNILQFQSLFEIIESLPIDAQAIERIFGKRQLFKKNYPENTALQKSAKRFMLNGGKLGIGVGIIPKYDI